LRSHRPQGWIFFHSSRLLSAFSTHAQGLSGPTNASCLLVCAWREIASLTAYIKLRVCQHKGSRHICSVAFWLRLVDHLRLPSSQISHQKGPSTQYHQLLPCVFYLGCCTRPQLRAWCNMIVETCLNTALPAPIILPCIFFLFFTAASEYRAKTCSVNLRRMGIIGSAATYTPTTVSEYPGPSEMLLQWPCAV
jgi:hypothetical protein